MERDVLSYCQDSDVAIWVHILDAASESSNWTFPYLQALVKLM